MIAMLCCICAHNNVEIVANEHCHVMDKSRFSFGEDHLYMNHIMLCGTHHGQFFDNHQGRRTADTHMLISMDLNELWWIDPRIRNPSTRDIVRSKYPLNFDLNRDYVNWKNRKALPCLRGSHVRFMREMI